MTEDVLSRGAFRSGLQSSMCELYVMSIGVEVEVDALDFVGGLDGDSNVVLNHQMGKRVAVDLGYLYVCWIVIASLFGEVGSRDKHAFSAALAG